MVKVVKSILILLISLVFIICQNQTDEKLCNHCECNFQENKFITKCINKDFKWTPEKWSNTLREFNVSQESKVMLILNGIKIQTLKKIPQIKVSKVDIILARCNLTALESGVFKNVKTLHYLDLGFNQLYGDSIRGDIFKGPYNVYEYEPIDMEILNIEHNLIHSLDRRMFQHTPKLKRLYLNDNPFDILDATTIIAISSIKMLEVLDMSRIGIKILPDEIFHNLKHLKQLYLSGNKLITVPETLSSLGTTLEILQLNENLFEEFYDNSFIGLWRLRHLEVSGMKTLKYVKSGSFIQLKSLKELHLCNNTNLKYISHEAFRELKDTWPIKKIYFNNNSLQSLPFDLVPWEKLNYLNIEDNPWDCNCNMIINFTKKIYDKLAKFSSATCVTPITMSGQQLRNLKFEDLCSSEMFHTNYTLQYNNKPVISYTRPSNILISFSIIVIITFASIIIGTRLKRKMRNAQMEQVRYSNIST